MAGMNDPAASRGAMLSIGSYGAGRERPASGVAAAKVRRESLLLGFFALSLGRLLLAGLDLDAPDLGDAEG